MPGCCLLSPKPEHKTKAKHSFTICTLSVLSLFSVSSFMRNKGLSVTPKMALRIVYVYLTPKKVKIFFSAKIILYSIVLVLVGVKMSGSECRGQNVAGQNVGAP